MTDRLPKDFYYLQVAEAVARRSTCMRKHWGAIIVKDDSIISTGYNGAPRGTPNCCDTGYCPRMENNVPRGTSYATCTSVHAEANAIIFAPREEMLHSTLYIYGYDVVNREIVKRPDSCCMCKRMIINAGIDQVCLADPDVGIPFTLRHLPYNARFVNVSDWIEHPDCLRDNSGY